MLAVFAIFPMSVVAGAAPARADASNLIPVRSVGAIVVDGVHKKVFVSDPIQSKIVVTDYSGAVVAKMANLPDVRGLALSADSGHLYAAVTGDDAIVSIATDTVTKTDRYPTGKDTDPAYLAIAGGKVWFSYGGTRAVNAGIGSLNLSGDQATVELDQDATANWSAAPKLAATPNAPDVLAAGDPDSSLVGVYDVATGAAVRKALRDVDNSRTLDLALTPDGSRLVMARVGGIHPILKTKNLTTAAAYQTQAYANAVAIAPNGTVAAGSNATYEPDVYIFTAGSMSAVRNYDFPDTDPNTSGADTLAVGGLAWETGGDRLFAVTNNSRGQYSLQVLTDTTKPTTDPPPSPILPVMSVGGFVVDGVHKKVFVSDPLTSKIIATDYTGKVLATREGLPTVQGLALSADSQQLYAAVTGDDAIVSIATDSVTEVARYDTGEATAPKTVAIAAGKLWFGYGGGDVSPNIGSLDLSGDKPKVMRALDTATEWRFAPQLTAAPGTSGVLAAAASDQIATYQVSTDAPVRLAVTSWMSVTGLALSPDGSRLITGSYSQHQVWQTSDLTSLDRYTDVTNSGAYFAFAPNGALAAGTDNWNRPAVFVFPPNSKNVIRTFDYPHTGHTSGPDRTADGAVAWEPNTDRLFTVSQNSEAVFSLRTFVDPAKSVPEVTVNAPAKGKRAKALTVTGSVQASLPLPAGTPLSVTRTDLETPEGTTLTPAKLDAHQKFSFTDTPPAGGDVTYRVSYAGDDSHTTADGSDTVAIDRDATTLTLNNNHKTFAYGTKASFTATLGKTYQNREVELWADPYGSDQPKKLIKRGTVNGAGTLSATVELTRNTVVTAVYAGDARTRPSTATATVYTKVKISTKVSRHYRTGKIGSTTYAYFHQRTNPLFTTVMTAAKDRAQVFELQAYLEGAWRAVDSQTFTLDDTGTSVVELTGSHPKSVRTRMRSSYERDTSGDNLNATTRGPWKYFIFTR